MLSGCAVKNRGKTRGTPMTNNRFSIAIAAALLLCVASVTPVRAHDMGAMEGMDHAMAPNAMGGHVMMDAHMTMTPLRPARAEDLDRARELLSTLRHSISRYRNYRVALAQGMRIFLPGVPQDVYHFVDYRASGEEYRGNFNPTRPGSVLYVKDGEGYRLVGAMYSAPPEATPDDLNALIPLSVARWHAHTNICLPRSITLDDMIRDQLGTDRSDVPGMLSVAANPHALELNRRLGFLADGRFGFEGRIADRAGCEAAGGHLIPQAFGWMVHVYPFAGDDLKVAFGTSVPKPGADSPRASR